jgi:hypothetical protein
MIITTANKTTTKSLRLLIEEKMFLKSKTPVQRKTIYCNVKDCNDQDPLGFLSF